MSKVALITGTSSGIGLASAVALAQAGYRVVATMRDTSKAGPLREKARAAGVELDIRALDVSDDASVQAAVAGVLKDHGRIDLLLNNAGAGHLGVLEQVSLEEARRTMEVNFFGVWRVTQAVLPAMREARSGRIQIVTSIGGLVGQPFNDAYCAAKFAAEGLVESMAPVLRRLGIFVSAIEPGPVATEFVASVQARLAGSRPLPAGYQPLLDNYLAGTRQAFSAAQTPDDVAKVIVEAATAETPHMRYATSEVVRGLVGRKFVDPTGDAALALSSARLG